MFFPGTLTTNRAKVGSIEDDAKKLGIVRGFQIARIAETTIWLQVYVE